MAVQAGRRHEHGMRPVVVPAFEMHGCWLHDNRRVAGDWQCFPSTSIVWWRVSRGDDVGGAVWRSGPAVEGVWRREVLILRREVLMSKET